MITHPGLQIVAIIKQRGWSITATARAAGISPPELCNVVKGKRGFSARVAIQLAKQTGHPPDHWWKVYARWQMQQALKMKRVGKKF